MTHEGFPRLPEALGQVLPPRLQQTPDETVVEQPGANPADRLTPHLDDENVRGVDGQQGSALEESCRRTQIHRICRAIRRPEPEQDAESVLSWIVHNLDRGLWAHRHHRLAKGREVGGGQSCRALHGNQERDWQAPIGLNEKRGLIRHQPNLTGAGTQIAGDVGSRRRLRSVEHPPINLEPLEPSRKRIRPGDIFVVRPVGREYLFGRVIDVDAHVLTPEMKAILMYIHYAWSASKREVPPLSRDRLLIPPVMINRLGWSRGFMETVEHRPLGAGEIFPSHCFVYERPAGPRYFDERGHELPGPSGPVGLAALSSYRSLDDKISRALGIPLSPEEQTTKPGGPRAEEAGEPCRGEPRGEHCGQNGVGGS